MSIIYSILSRLRIGRAGAGAGSVRSGTSWSDANFKICVTRSRDRQQSCRIMEKRCREMSMLDS